MVRVLIIAMVFVGMNANAQREQYIRPGLIYSGLTISPSTMLNRAESNYYLSGFLGGRLDDHLSFRGETHYFVDGSEDIPYLNFASRTFFGVQYHLSKGNFDSYFGFMPGISVLRINDGLTPNNELKYHAAPSFSTNIGVTYYVWKFFNFFANVTYVNSSVRGLRNDDGRTDEILVSAGLGLNINTVKAK